MLGNPSSRRPNFSKLFILLLLTACFAIAGRAQSALDGFDPNANGTINVVVVQPDGKILIGGSFTSLSPNGGVSVTRNRIARLNPDGTLDTGFNPNANGTVYAIAIQSDGKILVGGIFNGAGSIGGQARNRIARLDAVTGLADSFDPNANSGVYAIVVQSDGKIVVGGGFNGINSIGGQTRNAIARLDSVTGAADSFNPNASDQVLSIAIQTDGKILAGGVFTVIGGQPRNRIARLNATTGAADSWNPSAVDTVTAIALQPDGKILAGGAFNGINSIGGQTRNYVARLDALTGAADTFDPNANNSVVAIAVQTDGKILTGGAFTTLTPNGGAPITRNRIARLNANGTADSFDPNAGGIVYSIATQQDGKILAGGQFSIIGATTRNNSARLETDGRLDQTLNLSTVGSYVTATAIQPDGKILIGGLFTTVLGVTRNNIARLNTDGTLDTGFQPNADSAVFSIEVQSDGKILAGGQFSSIGGQTRQRIARLDATTGLADSFNPNANGIVIAIVVQLDGKILAGGTFTSIGGQVRNRIARLDAASGLADSFNPNASNSVSTIALQSDGKILVGGDFNGANSIGGQTRNFIARLDAATGLADSFNPNASGPVNVIAVQADGKILAGGQFNGANSIGGQARNRIARLDATTGLADALDPNANNTVSSLVIQADGKIVVGGFFNGANSIGGQLRSRIARLDATTGLADSFNPDANNLVYGITLQPDGKILVGGTFTGMGGQTRSLFARLTNDTASLHNITVTQTAVTWTRGGSSPLFTRVTFEDSTDGLIYNFLGNGTAGGTNWTLTGLNLSVGQNLYIRSRGFYQGGYENGSESIQQSVRNAFIASPTPTSTPTGTPTACPGTGAWSEQAHLLASDGAADDFFGATISISGDTAVVGSDRDDNGAGANAGAAYVYVRSGGVWTQQQKLTPSDAAAADRFGTSVAISGDTIVVGSAEDDTTATDTGSAYIFVRSGTVWTQQAKLTASDAAASDFFGVSAAMSAETVILGATGEDNAGGSNAGSAYVFTRSGTVWSQQQKLTANDGAASDAFGVSVSIDSDTVVVGATSDDTPAGVNAGSAYVFIRSGSVWAQQQKLTSSDAAANDFFGVASISGNKIVAGGFGNDTAVGVDAGSAYVFTRSGTVWTQQQILLASDAAAGDNFGNAVSIDGEILVVGSYFDGTAGGTFAGSAYVFGFNGTSWVQEQKLTASDGAMGDQLGKSVSIDGLTIAAGASGDDTAGGSNAGSAYIYQKTCPAPTPTFTSTFTPTATNTATATLTPTHTATSTPTPQCVGDTWTATSLTNAPTARDNHTAVWTGTEMIVWGGLGGGSFGARYNPATNAWTPTSTTNAPLGRDYHTAVWTGSEMIVWGGRNGGVEQNAGGRYNPTTDTWTAITAISPPNARFAHRSVWTGTEMIVWGGENSAGVVLDTGGRYNPVTNIWTATTMTNVPTGRSAHAAVWTGSDMIIWGGYGGLTGMNTGAKYDPVANTWLAITTTGAPLARYNHTTVWTGGEMIIWGGLAGSTTATGGRYNPSTDSWAATSAVNPPQGRSLHSAIWTGSDMIVWGGWNNDFPINTGGKFNLASNGWTATSTIGAPTVRGAHTAVFTGSEMIVWGGSDTTMLLNTGGRFCVPTQATPTATNTATVTNTATNTPTSTPTPTETPSISGTIFYGNAIGSPAPPRFVKNVSVASTAGSPSVGPVITGTPGTYTLTGFGSGSYTIKPTKPGGANGAINSFDAARVAQGASGAVPFVSQNQRFVADASGNGTVSSNDAAKIAQFAAGLPTVPPNLSGEWRFFVTGAPSPLPTPPQTYNDSRTYASVTSSLTGEDYIGLLVGDVSGNWNPATHPRPARTVESGEWRVESEDASYAEKPITVAVQDVVTAVDKEIFVPVNVQGVADKGIISYEFDLRYDPSVLQPLAEPVDVAKTVSRGLSVVTNAIEPGLLRVVVYGAIPIDSDGVLLNLRFTVVGSVGSLSPLTWERIMFNEGEMTTTVTDGKVELF